MLQAIAAVNRAASQISDKYMQSSPESSPPPKVLNAIQANNSLRPPSNSTGAADEAENNDSFA